MRYLFWYMKWKQGSERSKWQRHPRTSDLAERGSKCQSNDQDREFIGVDT